MAFGFLRRAREAGLQPAILAGKCIGHTIARRMKIFRSFAAVLIAAVVVTLVPAQQNEDIAVLRSKAEKGNGLAQYNLGLAYADGRGVAVDRIEAYVWLSLARENGARGRTLDALAASLDKDSLAAAQQRLADQKAVIAGKIPLVTTTKSEPEVVTTIKTTGAAYLAPDTVAVNADSPAVSAQIATLTADKKQLSEELAKAWKELDGLSTALKKARIEARTAKTPATSTADQENAAKFSRELEASVNHLNDQKARLEQSLAAAQTELASTKAELSSQTQKNRQLAAAEAARLTPSAEMAALRTKLGDTQAQVATLTNDLAAVRASETGLHDTVAQLEQEKAQLAAKPGFPDLSGKVSELETQLTEAKRNAESATQAADAASKKSAADLRASAAEVQRLQSALAAKPDAPSYPDLSGKVRELEATVADSKQKLAAADAAQSDLQRKLTEAGEAAQNSPKLVAEISQLQHERDELTSRSGTLAQENAQLRTDGDRLQKLLANSGKQLQESTSAANRVKELEAQTTELKGSLASAQAQVATLQQSLAARSAAPAYPDLSGKVRDLESRLAAANQQADAAVQTAVNASKQNTADLNNAAARISQLEAQLAAKPALAAAPDLSGRVKDLEKQLAAASAATERARQETVAMSKARDDASKNRGPAYPNLAGRVVELQTALADTKRDLNDAQTALRAAQQAQQTAAVPSAGAAVAAPEPAPAAADSSDLQKQLAETENKLTTALRGYALLQNERDTQLDAAAKSAETITNERNALSAQVATLTEQVEKLKTQGTADTAAAQAEAARVNESLAALQRSTGQNASELAAARALIQQLQGSNTVLANENYLLKTKLSPGPVAVPVPAAGGVNAVSAAAGNPRVHTVAPGDTLFRISQAYYGTTNRWQEIYRANAAKLGPKGMLKIGMELTIP